jgi:hypothetical protein
MSYHNDKLSGLDDQLRRYIMEINPGSIHFSPALHPEFRDKAMQVINDVNETAGRLMQVDDQINIDFNGRRGDVRVSNQTFYDTGNEHYSGSLSFDPDTHEKKHMHVEVKNNAGFTGVPKVILDYDNDYQAIPIFGSKKERFEKESQDGMNGFRSFVQIVDVDPRTGFAEYKEFIRDNTPPPPEPFPHHDPFPGHDPHHHDGHGGGGHIDPGGYGGGGHIDPGGHGGGGHFDPGGHGGPGGPGGHGGGGHIDPGGHGGGGGHFDPGGHGGPGGPGGGHGGPGGGPGGPGGHRP